LICKEEKRLNVFETLKHEFFNTMGQKKEGDFEEEEINERQISCISDNLEEFNNRFFKKRKSCCCLNKILEEP